MLSTADLGEAIYATPAIADGRLYVRNGGSTCIALGKIDLYRREPRF